MRNFYIILAFLTGLSLKSQDNSNAASVLTPVANQTGVPDISFPLADLPATKDFNVNLSVSYNPNAYRMGEYSGQVARNWMLSGSNFTISRKVMGSWIDEVDPANGDWNDIYYYTLNGEQGSFKFEKIGIQPNDTYHIVKLTPSNIKIEFERETLTPNRKPVKSFTITDSKGYKYYFQDYDYYKMPYDDGFDMRNTFYITKILDAKNRQIVTYTNKKYIKYKEHSNDTIIEGWIYLPEKIQTDYGSIMIEHGNSGTSFDFHDRYFFSGFTLRDHKDNFISKHILTIENSYYQFYNIFDEYYGQPETRTMITRNLYRISRLDKNSNVLDKTKFEYNHNPLNIYGPSPNLWKDLLAFRGIYRDDNPNSLMHGILKSIILPTGAKIDYQFGANKIRPYDFYGEVNKNTPEYIQKMQDPYDFSDPEIQYLEQVELIEFDTNDSRIYHITGLEHSPSSRIYISFQKHEIYPWPNDPENEYKGPTLPPKLAYKVKNTINTYPYNFTWYNYEIEDSETSYYYVVPSNGSAYIEITGSGGNGEIYIFEKHYTSPPYVNETTLPNSGVRIEKIQYFSRGDNFHPMYPSYASNPNKTITYDYNLFNEPGVPSGVAVADDQKEAIIYKNIKVTESDKGGYTKYYYKTPYDFPKYPHPTIPNNNNVWPNYNLLKKGIPDKQEIYDADHVKKQSTVFDYTLPAYDPAQIYKYEILCDHCDLSHPSGDPATIYTQERFAEKIKTEDYTYDSQLNSLKVTVERSFNLQNNNLMAEKKTSADGMVSEVSYKYAQEKNNTKLLNASMYSVPLEVLQKQNNVETGRVEMKFDHADNYFPSSVKKFGINNVLKAEEKNDLYDVMGNVLQTTTKTGIPTTFIYGYNGTLLLAQIEGATYAQVMQAFGLSASAEAYKNLEIYTKSNLDVNDATEETLRQKLDEFRLKPAFKDYQITTYTYDPLIGIKSVTSPSGNKEYYFYDNANRLIRVEDINHNVIKENKYKQYVFEY